MTDTHAFKHIPRERLTDHERAELFLEKGGRCHKCTRKIRPGNKWIAEHLHALCLGGDNKWANWDITCEWCLPKKNAEDATKAAKGRAIAVAHVIPPSQRQKRGRTMPGSRASPWKKTFAHGWVKR